MKKLRRRCSGLIVAGLLAVAIAFGGLSPQARAEDDEAEITKIGTYAPQMVFQQSPGQADLMEAYEEAQGPMQEAQEEGDQEEAQRLQMELQEKQQEIIEDFQDSIGEVLPEIADEEGVQLVAAEIKWSDDDIEQVDLTDQIIEAIGGDPEEAEETMPQPRE